MQVVASGSEQYNECTDALVELNDRVEEVDNLSKKNKKAIEVLSFCFSMLCVCVCVCVFGGLFIVVVFDQDCTVFFDRVEGRGMVCRIWQNSPSSLVSP